nr:hypothetical protein [Spirochaetota bacterium]
MVGNEGVRMSDVHSVRAAEPASADTAPAQAIMNTLSGKVITDAFQKATGSQTETRASVLIK